MQTITLESLLIGDLDAENSVVLEPYEAAMECADAFQECAEIEQNLTTYEAAKLIKKSKSASKKVKTTISKMKAKYAKAKKAGGKVIKIRKVTKESDEYLDGATGPTPTTTDTNGLTDTDLDVDPDAEVEVIEVADDQPTTQESAAWEGMVEGKDYFVEYEDESILQLEAGAGNMLKKFGNAIKALWDKILTFVRSIIVKINDALGIDRRFLDKHKDAIIKGLTSDAEVSARVGKLATASVSKTEDASVEITPWQNVLDTVSGLSGDFNKAIQSDDELAKLHEKITSIKTGAVDAAKVDKGAKKVKINTIRFGYDAILKFIIGGSAEFKKVRSDVKRCSADALREAKAAETKDKPYISRIRKASSLVQKAVASEYSVYLKIRGAVMAIARAAAKAGGAMIKEEEDDDDQE